MGQAEKDRELLVCRLVADRINSEEGTDYHPIPCLHDPPDVLLVSDSGKYPTREAEVVSTPQDFTIRNDNKNVQKFERDLQAALATLDMSGWDVTVHWHHDAIERGIRSTLIPKLAQIIVATAPSEGWRHVSGVEIYEYSPEVARHVHYFRALRQRSAKLSVHSSCVFWAPIDGSWIEEAVTKKAGAYDPALAARLLLVIDGLHHLDSEQMNAYLATTAPDRIPFAEVWAVTMGRPYRLKP